MPARDLDSYSFPAPGEDLCDWLRALTDAHADRPVIPSSWELLLPQIADANEGVPARAAGRGRPSRAQRPFTATEVAIARDIEGMPVTAVESWRTPTGLSGVTDSSTGVQSTARAVTYSRDSWTSKTDDRWRNDGRRILALSGAWPLALGRPDGELGRVWWREERYRTALRDWAEGRLP
jgi:hypothetical protein